MYRFILIIPFFILRSFNCFAQLPNTDIWLLDIKTTKDSIFLTNPVNITNRTGYDNQPSFSPDGKSILYTSMRDGKQTDIYKYDLTTKTSSQFTNTTTSEYSPNVMPDGKNISVVMVEPDSTQRLWKFSIKGGEPSLIMKDVDSVGYYCWIDKKTLATCIITNPMHLIVFDIESHKKTMSINNVGRCLHSIKKNNTTFFFYSRDSTIYCLSSNEEHDFRLRSEIWDCMSQDFDLLGIFIISGEHSNIYYYKYDAIWKGGKDYKWELITDLSVYGISNITRIAVSPDGKKMAIVGEIKN